MIQAFRLAPPAVEADLLQQGVTPLPYRTYQPVPQPQMAMAPQQPMGRPQPATPMVNGQPYNPADYGYGQAAAPAAPAEEEPTGLLGNMGYNMTTQGLLGLGSALMQASAPSTNPANLSLGYALGKGLEGMNAGMTRGMQLDEYQRKQREAELVRKARENLVKKYGDMARLAPEAVITSQLETDAKNRELARIQSIFQGVDDGEEGRSALQQSLGFKPTASELAVLRAAAASGDITKVQGAISDMAGQRYTIGKDLRKAFSEEASGVQKIISAANRIASMPADGNLGVQDVETLYSFISALDPESVVREGEIALAGQAASLLERLRLARDQVGSGQLLPESVRDSIRERVIALGRAAEQNLRVKADYYAGLGERYGLDRDLVIGPLSGVPSTAPRGGGSGGATDVVDY